MGLLSGSITGRRFHVLGTMPDAYRELLQDRLTAHAFREPPAASAKQGEPVEGWCRVQNLLRTDFEEPDTWLFDKYVVFCLRVDVKKLPTRLLTATVEIKCDAWKKERGVERVPSAVKKEIRENIEVDWLGRVFPTVKTVEIVWNVLDGWAIVATQSDALLDRVKKRFHRSFGFDLIQASPLDVLSADQQAGMLALTPFTLRE